MSTKTGQSQSHSLIVTAKLNDVDARPWLADVVTRIAEHPCRAGVAPIKPDMRLGLLIAQR